MLSRNSLSGDTAKNYNIIKYNDKFYNRIKFNLQCLYVCEMQRMAFSEKIHE